MEDVGKKRVLQLTAELQLLANSYFYNQQKHILNLSSKFRSFIQIRTH